MSTKDLSSILMCEQCVIGTLTHPGAHVKSFKIMGMRALYGLKTTGARFYEKIAETMYHLGFMPSKADSDVRMKDCKDHWEYVCTWIDDLLYARHNRKVFYDALCELKYQLKGVNA
eukprot:823885-Ditylum_brightwellii.AAC.1